MSPPPAGPSPASQLPRTPVRPIDLKRRLLLRVTAFALVLLGVASVLTLEQAARRIRADIQRTGGTIQQLIGDEVARSTSAFDRRLDNVDLSSLAGVGELVPFCAAIEDLYRRRVAHRCFGEPEADGSPPPASAHPLAALLAERVGPQAVFHGVIRTSPGVKIAELSVTPHFDSEARALWRQLRSLLLITAAILLINVLIYRPVQRALAPTDDILRRLARMEDGDLSVRMPAFELVELDRIGQVFNHLAERLQHTQAQQQQLAQRLLDVREEERRHLARELHDELGQCLASINAEAAYAAELADEKLPQLQPCAAAISRTTAHMMEVLQQMLHRLRPVGLDEFGLAASLAQLVSQWQRQGRGTRRCTLTIDGTPGPWPDPVNVSLYRIVQESLTNAAKHQREGDVQVHLQAGDAGITLCIDDAGAPWPLPPSAGGNGFGLLGMHERVQALGGHLKFQPGSPQGVRLLVHLPLHDKEMRP